MYAELENVLEHIDHLNGTGQASRWAFHIGIFRSMVSPHGFFMKLRSSFLHSIDRGGAVHRQQ